MVESILHLFDQMSVLADYPIDLGKDIAVMAGGRQGWIELFFRVFLDLCKGCMQISERLLAEPETQIGEQQRQNQPACASTMSTVERLPVRTTTVISAMPSGSS